MNKLIVAAAAVAAVALAGCRISGRSEGQVSAGVAVEVDHDYAYFPSHRAYHCNSCNDWWVIGAGGGWTRTTVRPVSLVITDNTPWVTVTGRGSTPHLRYSDDARQYPSDWKPAVSKGPPPGRGWRK